MDEMDKAGQALLGIFEANKRKWQRLVEDSQELRADLDALRVRHGFPLKMSKVAPWIDKAGLQERKQLSQEIADLATKHGIPQKWRNALWHLAVTGRAWGLMLEMGFPSGRFVPTVQQTEHGESSHVKHEIVIDSETAVNNPIVQKFIQEMRKQFLEKPPKPQPTPGNPRKLNWQPVWEWHKQHPDITLKEIADMLNYSHGYVRQKLAGFDG